MPVNKNLFNVIRIIVPLVLFVIILKNIDIYSLRLVFKEVNITYLALSIFFANILQVIGGAIRWYSLIPKSYRIPNIFYYLKVYNVAMFYGYFVPSNIGMDVFRVIAVSKKKGSYEGNAIILIGEKFYTLLFSVAVLFISYLLAAKHLKNQEIISVMDLIGKILIVAVLVFSLLIFCGYKKRGMIKSTSVFRWISGFSSKLISALSRKLKIDTHVLKNAFPLFFKPVFVSKALLFTVLLKISLTIGGYFLFLSLNIELSFWKHLFAYSLFFVLFLLPVSFGSLGIREGSYILIYGLFGVGQETALAASLFALSGLVIVVLFGGLISLFETISIIKKADGS